MTNWLYYKKTTNKPLNQCQTTAKTPSKLSELLDSYNHLEEDFFTNKTLDLIILKKISVLNQFHLNQYLLTIKMECNHIIGAMNTGVLNGTHLMSILI